MQLFKRLGMYWKYSTRSLARGGQRTLLAIFCVAVGVLAIVALQLVGNMVGAALSTNVREGNGGDISIRSDITPLSAQQLATFDQLKSDGTITSYTAVSTHDAQSQVSGGKQQRYSLYAVDPATFPAAGAPIFNDPSGGSFSSLITGNTVVVTQTLLDDLKLKRGDTVTVIVPDDGRQFNATIGGVIAAAGFFHRAELLVSIDTYKALTSSAGLPVRYTAVYANVPGGTDANEDTAKTAIANAVPTATITTTKDALQQQQDNVQGIRNFLQIVGLLALLIGGVGIINTMQVMLRRRRVEIAMLKTTGYRQRDLYAMFGLEAALLGLLGGAVGSAIGVGVSFLVKGLVERLFQFHLPTVIDPVTVASGVAIGLFTALIFGILPIVQAGQVRPQAVLRELPEGGGVRSALLSIGLVALLAVLFFALALSILQNTFVTLIAVGGAGLFLFLLSLVFALVVFLLSRFPVLERPRLWYLLVVGAALVLSIALALVQPAIGALFAVIALADLVLVFLPRSWKTNVKMALRNIGRGRTRTVTTLVALFIGVFAIGLILVLGQNIKDKINTALSTQIQYNSFILAGPADKAQVDAQIAQIGGVKGERINTIAQAQPVAVDDRSIKDVFAGVPDRGGGQNVLNKQEAISYISAPIGWDISALGSVPDVTISSGQNLSAADAGTNNVLMPDRAKLPPLSLKLGSTITMLSSDGKTPLTVTVKGFYSGISLVGGGMYSDNSVTQTLSGGHQFYVYQLILDPRQAADKLNTISAAVPGATTFNLADITVFINDLLNNLIVMLTAIASLAMIAGLIIIANAVALAMLERRRELGILKAVGHTSRSVLSGVLVENGIIGFTGGLLAMLLVALALALLGAFVSAFKDFSVAWPITVGIVLATGVVCMLVAAFVAVRATRVRPLEVLRYE